MILLSSLFKKSIQSKSIVYVNGSLDHFVSLQSEISKYQDPSLSLLVPFDITFYKSYFTCKN